jgi:hypothetical protein
LTTLASRLCSGDACLSTFKDALTGTNVRTLRCGCGLSLTAAGHNDQGTNMRQLLMRPLAAAALTAASLLPVSSASAQAPSPQAQSAQVQSPSPSEQAQSIPDEKLDATAAAVEKVASVKESYQGRFEAATPTDRPRIAEEAKNALEGAVTGQGLSVDEYNSILTVAQNDSGVREKLLKRIRPSEKQ